MLQMSPINTLVLPFLGCMLELLVIVVDDADTVSLAVCQVAGQVAANLAQGRTIIGTIIGQIV